MRASLPRQITRTLPRRLLAPASGASCPGTAAKTVPQKPTIALPPVRYHVFHTPLPYPQGLELQHRVIEGRLQRRERGESSAQDVMFLLGKWVVGVGEEELLWWLRRWRALC
jgi:hypothetical protein